MSAREGNVTPQVIQDAAAELFGTLGFHATSLRRLAAHVGVTLGTLYHYYPTKQKLLLELMDQAIDPLLDSVGEAMAVHPSDPVSQLCFCVKNFCALAASKPTLVILGDTELRALKGKALRHVLDRRDQYQHAIEAMVDQGVQAGVLTPIDSKLATYSILATCNEIARWYRPDGRLSLVELSQLHAELALATLGYRATTPASDIARAA
jgi:AcrR family transcriptional regulator